MSRKLILFCGQHVEIEVFAFGKNRFPCFYKRGSSEALHLGLPPRVKIRDTTEYAGMMKLVNIQDLGDVTSVKVFLSPPARKIKYAPVAKMVYAADLGSASLVNRGSSPLGRTTNKTAVHSSGLPFFLMFSTLFIFLSGFSASAVRQYLLRPAGSPPEALRSWLRSLVAGDTTVSVSGGAPLAPPASFPAESGHIP